MVERPGAADFGGRHVFPGGKVDAADASAEASANVRDIAAAADELAASVQEIDRQVAQSSHIAEKKSCWGIPVSGWIFIWWHYLRINLRCREMRFPRGNLVCRRKRRMRCIKEPMRFFRNTTPRAVCRFSKKS